MQKIDKLFDNQIVRFLFIGGLAFIAEYLLFTLIIRLFNSTLFIYNISQTISMITGAIISFFLNKLWAFKTKKNTLLQGIKYLIVFLLNLLITNILIRIFHDILLVNNLLLIKLILVCFTTTWNFFLYKYFVYRK